MENYSEQKLGFTQDEKKEETISKTGYDYQNKKDVNDYIDHGNKSEFK